MLTTHIIAAGAARAAAWYTDVLGAAEQNRITLPDGRLIHVELHFGPSVVMLADEFPEHGALSPATTGCTSWSHGTGTRTGGSAPRGVPAPSTSTTVTVRPTARG